MWLDTLSNRTIKIMIKKDETFQYYDSNYACYHY